jgi:hypothetical protein
LYNKLPETLKFPSTIKSVLCTFTVPPSFFTPTVPFLYRTIGHVARTTNTSEIVPKRSRRSVIIARREGEEDEEGADDDEEEE